MTARAFRSSSAGLSLLYDPGEVDESSQLGCHYTLLASCVVVVHLRVIKTLKCKERAKGRSKANWV